MPPSVSNLKATRRRRSLKPEDLRQGLTFVRLVEETVSAAFQVPLSALLSSRRGTARISLARQVAMYLTHVVGGFRLSEIGQAFDRDRTTVAHACAVVENRRDDPAFNRTLDLLEIIIVRLRRLTRAFSPATL